MGNGRAMGSTAPYGMAEGPLDEKAKRTWVPCPEEQAVIQRVVQLYAKDMSLGDVAATLTAEGVPSGVAEIGATGRLRVL